MSTLGKRKERENGEIFVHHGSTLFVSNLPYTATTTDLKTLFSDIAPVRSAFVVLEHGTGVSKGVGYVSFAIPEDAKAAFDSISANGIALDGRSLRVDWAANKPTREERADAGATSSSVPSKAQTSLKLKPISHSIPRDPLAIRTIVISGLPSSVDSKTLWKKLRKCEGAGEVQWPTKDESGAEDASIGSPARIHFNRSMLLTKGSAHVLFSSPSTAQEAVDKLHAHVFKGSLLSASLKKRLDGAVKQSRASASKPGRASRLIVRNLPFDITEQDLRAVFLPHGSIYSIDIPRADAGHEDSDAKAESDMPRAQPRGKGFAFVWMWNKKEAEAAMSVSNGMRVYTGLAADLVGDKQKTKKARREEKKQAEAKDGAKDLGRTIAVDWALSKDKWESEKKVLNGEAADGSQNEPTSEDEEGSVESDTDEPELHHSRGDVHHETDDSDTEMDDASEEKARPTLPPPEAGTTLFVRNIPFLATEDELRDLFRKFGPLRYARITMDAATGRSRGTGFVCFWNLADADKVIEQSNILRAEMTGETEASLPKKNPFAMASILTPDPSALSAQSLVLHGRTLDVVRAVTREEAGKLKEEGERAREKADKRNMYLLREGVILPGTPAADTLPAAELEKRTDAYNARRTLLRSNPSLYISKTRLSIRQLPIFVTERMLKRLARHAMHAFDEDVLAGSRVGLTEEEVSRDEPAEEDPKSKKKKEIPKVRQAKIVRQADRVDPLTGKGRSKGYGFLELRDHASALRVLRWANNNPAVSPLFEEWRAAEQEERKKGDDSSQAKVTSEAEGCGANAKQAKGTLIIEFSIENIQVVQRRTARQQTGPNDTKAKKARPSSTLQDSDVQLAKRRRKSADGEPARDKRGPRLRSVPGKKKRSDELR
ncbi:hypothetical protein BC834DRAFT_899152 [Gloeopeniophorella convolvens]|nr:hypothetical protein BC834DRAFT_899152 [Gloeopeniophorella convolvens]